MNNIRPFLNTIRDFVLCLQGLLSHHPLHKLKIWLQIEELFSTVHRQHPFPLILMIHCDFFDNHAFFLSQLICYGYILDTSCILWNNSQLFQQRDPWQPHDQLQSCVPFPFFANPYHRRQLLQGDGLQIDQKISRQFFFSKFNLNLQLSVATFSRAFPTSLSLLLNRLRFFVGTF